MAHSIDETAEDNRRAHVASRTGDGSRMVGGSGDRGPDARPAGGPGEGRWVARGGRRTGVTRALGAVLLAALVGGAGLLASVRPAADTAFPGGPVLAYNPYNLVRLHVLGATDDPGDQTLKLQARDAVISFLASRWGGVRDTAGALVVLEANRQELTRLLEHLVASSGRDYGVTVEVGYFPFPERDYGRLTLPAGTYPALRVILGQGKGQNWWCVLFPPLCFLEAQAAPPDALPLAPEEAALLLTVDTGDLTPGRVYAQTHGQVSGQVNGQVDGQVYGQAHGQVRAQIQVRSFLLDWLRRRGVDPGTWVQRWREEAARP